MKAIVLLDLDGLALAPATLCAEAAGDARNPNLPLFDHVLAQLSAGKELRVKGPARYELCEAGKCIAILEVLDSPSGVVPS